MKDGPAAEEADDGGQDGEEDGLHPRDGIAGRQKKSMESIRTRLTVGTGPTAIGGPDPHRPSLAFDHVCRVLKDMRVHGEEWQVLDPRLSY